MRCCMCPPFLPSPSSLSFHQRGSSLCASFCWTFCQSCQPGIYALTSEPPRPASARIRSSAVSCNHTAGICVVRCVLQISSPRSSLEMQRVDHYRVRLTSTLRSLLCRNISWPPRLFQPHHRPSEIHRAPLMPYRAQISRRAESYSLPLCPTRSKAWTCATNDPTIWGEWLVGKLMRMS